MIPNPGTYQGKLNGVIVIYESPTTGALCAAIPVRIDDPVQWSGKHTMTLVKGDGTVQTRTIETMKAVFGWDGIDPFWLTETAFDGLTFELVCIHEPFTPKPTDDNPDPQPVTAFKVQWLNPVGGSSRMPEPADRKAVLAKYGSKFRALSPVKPAPAAKKAPTPPTKPAPAAGPPATMEEAWEACQRANTDLDAPRLEELWFKKIAELFPGKENSDLTPAQWGTIKATWAK